MSTTIRSWTELSRLKTFEERYRYLKLGARVGRATFGWDRYLNQNFYRSAMWKHARDLVITRDDGCDLGIQDRVIYDKILIHHMNPITLEELEHGSPDIIDPEYLICVSHNTHNAIHYGDESLLVTLPKERRPGDTRLW